MLTRDRPTNYLHWLAPDDTHILIEGGPVDYFIFHPDGHAEKITLGRDVAVGQRPVIAVPGGCWKVFPFMTTRKLRAHGQCSLAGIYVDRVKIGAGPAWVKRFTGSAPWATPKFLRSLIGPTGCPTNRPEARPA